MGVHYHLQASGEVLIATSRRAPGLEAHVYHSRDGGATWTEVMDPALPDSYTRVPVVLFEDHHAWIMTEKGQVFRADDRADDPALVVARRAGHSCSRRISWSSPSSVNYGFA